MQRQDTQMGHVPNTVSQPKMPASSSRILLDVPCKVCRDNSSGKHYGIYACDGCAGFFKRSIRKARDYKCKNKANGGCMVDKVHRNQCRACRLTKCLMAGMNREAVQHERGPRNSTLKKHMALYYSVKPHDIMASVMPTPTGALNLVVPKTVPDPITTAVTMAAHHAYSPSIYTNGPPPKRFKQQTPSPPPVSGPQSASLAVSPFFNYTYTRPQVTASCNSLMMTETALCEQAARLIFVNVTWVKSINATTELCVEDQLTLLESSWRELFLLAAAQCVPNLDPTPLLPTVQGVGLALEVTKFREVLIAFNALNLNAQEYSCVRAIVLYKAGLDNESVPSSRSSTGSTSPICGSRLKDTAVVAKLRDNAQKTLGQKMDIEFSATGAMKFSRLILMLPMLRNVSAQAIEEIFFKKTIGETRIEKILCDVYAKTETTPCD